MKSMFTFSSLVLSLGLTAQTLMPNGDMEQWNSYQTSGAQTYNDLGPNQDRTQNFLRTLNAILESPTTAPSAFRLDGANAYNGTYSLQIVTDAVAGAIIVPGYLGTGDVDIANQTIYLGRPYTQSPERMTGYYQYAPVSGDSAAFYVELTRYDALNQTKEVVGTGNLIITAAQNAWTQFSVDINYTSQNTPDSINIIMASSAGYDLVNLQNSAGQLGSALSLDDLSFEFPASIEETDEANIQVFPNPASDHIQVQVQDINEPVRLRLYNLNGQLVREVRNQADQLSMDLQDLSNGQYILVVQTDFKLIGRQKISVAR